MRTDRVAGRTGRPAEARSETPYDRRANSRGTITHGGTRPWETTVSRPEWQTCAARSAPGRLSFTPHTDAMKDTSSDSVPHPTIPDDIAAGGPAADESVEEVSTARADDCILYPAGNRLIIRRDEASDFSRGGIIIPDTARDRRTTRGTVLAVGPGKWSEQHQTYSPMPYHAGDVVLFGKYSGHDIEAGGVEFAILTEDEIMVKVVPMPQPAAD